MTVKLLSIEATGPVRIRELGRGGEGIDWTVQPANFPQAIEMINSYGGPDAWRIEEVGA